MTHITRDAIVDEAVSWVGTPYRHLASAKGAGCDCLGLVRGVWRRFYGPEPQRVPHYTPDWAERRGEETLRAAAERYLTPVSGTAQPGDVLLFRMETDAPAKHCAIAIEDGQMVHAYWAKAVSVHQFSPWWKKRLAGVFEFPGLPS